MARLNYILKLNDRIFYIHEMNLRSLDLNLLVVFDALMHERHVTRAARAVGLSQPAFSNALTRLRNRLGDELFVRTNDGMKPTPWAVELSGPVSKALMEIENALESASFDPSTSNKTFTIATLDYATIAFFPALVSRLRREAPNVTCHVITPSEHLGELLDLQRADIALISWPDPPDRFVSESLIAEDWVCVMRPDHPLAGKQQTLERYTSVDHLHVSPSGEQRNWIDDALAEQGRTRHIAYAMPTYGPAPLVLDCTDLVLTCPGSVAKVLKERTGMLVSPCPIPTPPRKGAIDMIWHSRLSNHPAQLWLRDVVRTAAKESL